LSKTRNIFNDFNVCLSYNFLNCTLEKVIDQICFYIVYNEDYCNLIAAVYIFRLNCLRSKFVECGAVAQLGERLTGSQEVDSSILFSSTIIVKAGESRLLT
jgi:hypothetical protein